jgi:hypothetical protein
VSLRIWPNTLYPLRRFPRSYRRASLRPKSWGNTTARLLIARQVVLSLGCVNYLSSREGGGALAERNGIPASIPKTKSGATRHHNRTNAIRSRFFGRPGLHFIGTCSLNSTGMKSRISVDGTKYLAISLPSFMNTRLMIPSKHLRLGSNTPDPELGPTTAIKV